MIKFTTAGHVFNVPLNNYVSATLPSIGMTCLLHKFIFPKQFTYNASRCHCNPTFNSFEINSRSSTPMILIKSIIWLLVKQHIIQHTFCALLHEGYYNNHNYRVDAGIWNFRHLIIHNICNYIYVFMPYLFCAITKA